jgi:hypothetical protein
MPKRQKPKKTSTATVEYEKLGRQLVELYETGYFDRRQVYKMTFIKGVLAGFGGVIGATIVVALILWLLSFFNEVPLLGPFIEDAQNTIQSHEK